MFPSLRLELFGIGAEVFRSTMHSPHGVAYDLAFKNEDGRFAVGTATNWEDGVSYSLAAVDRDNRVNAESCETLAE